MTELCLGNQAVVATALALGLEVLNTQLSHYFSPAH
jgi:hypothetical protein